jgi:hypothetical protein
LPSAVATVIVAVPPFMAVTRPDAFTVATPVLLLDHVIALFVAYDGKTVAVSVSVLPAINDVAVLFSVTLVTGSITRTGEFRCVVVPSPSSPKIFHPQAQGLSSLFSAAEYAVPADTEAQSVAVPIRTGEFRCVVVPSPSWPSPLSPQAQRLPSLFSANVWFAPADTATQSVAVPTRTGVFWFMLVPSPSWPE